jgi:O-antigen/teichoic acid export membrane protein
LSIKKRLISGISSGVVGTVATILIQLIGIPILLIFWGTELYGEWLVLFTLPSYIAMSDIGLGTVVCTEINVLISQNKNQEAKQVFKSAFNFIVKLGLIPLIIFILISFWPQLRTGLNIEKINGEEFTYSFIFLSVYSFLAIIITLPQGLYRSIGLFARGQYVSTSFRLLEFFMFLTAVLLRFNIIGVAFTYLVARLLYAVYVMYDLNKKTEIVEFSLEKTDYSNIKSMIKPSLSMMSVYLGQSFTSQGIILIISIALGSVSVAIFSTIRTLCNMAKQPLMIISLVFWGEFTTAFAQKDKKLIDKLFKIANLSTIALSILAAIFLYFFGEWILKVWTQGAIKIQEPFYTVFLLSIITNVFWYTRWNFLLSINKHTKAVYFYFCSTLITLSLMWLLTPMYGLVIVAIGLVLMDLFMIPVLHRLSHKIFSSI